MRLKESEKIRPNEIQNALSRIDTKGKNGLDYLKQKGIEFVSINKKADIGISKYGYSVKGITKDKCILFKAEPPIYNLFYGLNLCNPKYMKQFKAVIADYMVDDLEQIYFTLPRNDFQFIPQYFDVPKTEFLCTILLNKKRIHTINNFVPLHSIRKYNKYSNIKFRIKADKMFCDYFSNKYQSYGKGWNKQCYIGPVLPNKHFELLSKYKFNFCPENSRFNGYITEKPIQALCCGSIPIYLGAPDIENYLPKGTFIDMREFTLKELCYYLENMGETDYNKYLKNIKNYFKSDFVDVFSSLRLSEKLIKILEDKI